MITGQKKEVTRYMNGQDWMLKGLNDKGLFPFSYEHHLVICGTFKDIWRQFEIDHISVKIALQ